MSSEGPSKLSEISNNEFFENLASHSTQSTIKDVETKNNVLIRAIVPTAVGVGVLE